MKKWTTDGSIDADTRVSVFKKWLARWAPNWLIRWLW